MVGLTPAAHDNVRPLPGGTAADDGERAVDDDSLGPMAGESVTVIDVAIVRYWPGRLLGSGSRSSWMVSVPVLQNRLGHSSIKVTLDTYGHLFEVLDEAAAERLDAAFPRISPNSSRTPGRNTVVEINR